MTCGRGVGEMVKALFVCFSKFYGTVSFNTVESLARTEISYSVPETLVATLFDKRFLEIRREMRYVRVHVFISTFTPEEVYRELL